VIHKITDICTSELTTREESKSLPSTSDIKLSIPQDLSQILESYQCDIATWEQAEWIYLTKSWDQWLSLVREYDEDSELHGKRLIFLQDGRFRIEAF
jgi:hypothetical protein